MARLPFATLLALIVGFCFPAAAQVLTAQYDNARTGATLNETKLTPVNVNASHFGKIFSFAVDGDVYAHAKAMRDTVIPAMVELRTLGDKLEGIVADDLWPLPSYREMLFIR